MKERRNYYYDSPFYYGLITWRKRLFIVVAFFVFIVMFHADKPHVSDHQWLWTAIIFGLLFALCYIKLRVYETYLLEAMGPLDNNTIIGSLSFERLERQHEVWYEKKFGYKPPKTNTWSVD